MELCLPSTQTQAHTACLSGSTGVQVSTAYGGCVVGLLADLWTLCLHRLGIQGAWGEASLFHNSLGTRRGLGWEVHLGGGRTGE